MSARFRVTRGGRIADIVLERDFRQLVVDYARTVGWKVYFTWNSQHSPAGYPDLTMVRGTRLVFAELKREGAQPTAAQRDWLAALRGVPGAEVFVWRPADFDGEVRRVLDGQMASEGER